MRLANWAALTVALLFLSACGGSSNPTTPSGSSSSTAIKIVGQNGTQAFNPNPAPFGGQQVVFTNNDGTTHRIVLNDGSFDSGDIAPGASSRTVVLPSSGANFHCTIHPGMIGSVNAASGSAPPPCEGAYCSPY
jgi:plastocyanin